MLVVGLVFMTALPLAYRMWTHFHPQPAERRQSVSGLLAKAAEVRAVLLLQTPLAKWTDYDRKSEPAIHAWLEAHAKTVLPWEWTDAARRKDPDGYLALWRGLFGEQRDELDRRLKLESGRLKSLERKLWIAEKVQGHRANRLVRALSHVATNSFHLTLEADTLVTRVGLLRERVETIGELVSRNESISKLETVDDGLFISETCRFLKAGAAWEDE